MSRARETNLTFFFTYLSPLKLKACTPKIDFLDGFLKNLSFKIEMSGRADVGHHPRFTFRLTFFEKPVHNAAWHFSCLFFLGPSLSANRIAGYYRMYEWRIEGLDDTLCMHSLI